MKLLHQLYFIHSPSKQEQGMSRFLRKYLKSIGITNFNILGNQIYRIIPDTPMLCAHMDQVQTKRSEKLFIDHKKNTIWSDQGLGADDKNGIYILLNLLKKHKNVSFILSDQEEIGGNISKVLDKIELDNKGILKTIKYCLVFDRRNGYDILAKKHGYCEKDLNDDLAKIGKEFKYKTTTGSWCDCDSISLHIPCTNLSCGYYKPHTIDEYTDINELKNALAFGDKILSTLDKKYDRLKLDAYSTHTVTINGKKVVRRYKTYNKTNYYNDPWYSTYNRNYNNWDAPQANTKQLSYFPTADEENILSTKERLYYCYDCGEFYYSEMFSLKPCPSCGSKIAELVGHDASIYKYHKQKVNTLPTSTKKMKWWCSHCDISSDEDDCIIGMEDSPEICKICGNIRWRIEEKEDEDDSQICENCTNYSAMLLDNSSCGNCKFLSKTKHHNNKNSIITKIKNKVSKFIN